MLRNHPPHPLAGDVCDGRVLRVVGFFGELHEDELAVAAVFLVEIEHGVGGGTGACKEVEDDVVFFS